LPGSMNAATAGNRISRAFIIWPARAGMAFSPSFLLAIWARAFTRRALKRGRRLIAERHVAVRLLASTAAPFSRLEFDIGGKCVTVEVVPWLAWFRSSIYARALSKSDLIDLSRRFSSKVRLRVIVPSGPPLPLAPYPGALSDAIDEILEWLITTYL
jgi:hypothetical protein